MAARISAAQVLLAEMPGGKSPCPLLVDPITDEANIAYGGRPERLYIVKEGRVAYEGAVGPYGYDLVDMEASLKKLVCNNWLRIEEGMKEDTEKRGTMTSSADAAIVAVAEKSIFKIAFMLNFHSEVRFLLTSRLG